MKRALNSSCAIAAICLLAPQAAAQETVLAQAQPDNRPPADDGGLTDIIVTATRRSSNLQSTPLAVSAVDTATIAASNPTNIGDLAKFVPNFSAAKVAGFNAASFAMRGVGANNIIVYYESPVAVLVDDFVVPSIQSQLLDTFDVQQVEVLRGPQGTLFGKNTTGGAVSVRTKRPELGRYGSEMRVELGDFKTVVGRAALNIPLGDKAALRIVGGYDYTNGFMRNGEGYGPIVSFAPSQFAGALGSAPGNRVGGTRSVYGRAKLLFEPSDRVSSLTQFELLRDDSPTPAVVNLTPPDNLSYLFNSLGLTSSVLLDGADPFQSAGITGRQDRFQDQRKGSQVHIDGIYNTTDFDLGPGRVTNVIGYRSQRSRISSTYTGEAPVSQSGRLLSLFDALRADNHKTFQEEVRFASDLDGPFNFVSGAFHQRDRIKFCSAAYVGINELFGATTPFGSYNDVPLFQCSNQKMTSTAVFAEGTIEITPKLKLIGGGRFSWEDKKWSGRQQVAAQFLGVDPQTIDVLDLADFEKYPAGVIRLRTKVSEPTYRVSLSYQVDPDIYLYATYSRGFKTGGFNDNIGSDNQFGTDLSAYATAAQATSPEFADSFEGGFKSEFLDSKIRFNLTGFYVKYSDLQRQVQVPIVVAGRPAQITAFFNAASARVYGLEAEFAARPTDRLMLNAVAGYQNGKYKSYDAPFPAGYDLAEAPLDRTPKWQWTVSANYTLPLSDTVKLVAGGDVNYTGRNLYTQSITSLANNTYLDARTLVNASLTLADVDDRWRVRLVGQNLTDETYLTAAQSVDPLWVFGMYGRPRYFAIEVGFKL